jgi:hypothetical protein
MYEGSIEMIDATGVEKPGDPLADAKAWLAAMESSLRRARGESDPPRICARTIKELGVPLPD